MNILLVEDDVFYRDMLAKMVRGWGHDVVCAETGRGGLEKAMAMDFDLFLMDVFLPDMTAMDLIPRVREFRPDARVITLTGQSTRSLELKLRELGIAYYMAKPVPARRIEEHLGPPGPAQSTAAVSSPRFDACCLIKGRRSEILSPCPRPHLREASRSRRHACGSGILADDHDRGGTPLPHLNRFAGFMLHRLPSSAFHVSRHVYCGSG